MFQPRILNPTPDPWFVRELRKIDPDLHLVWGYGRYLKYEWAIERKIPPERYFTIYAELLSSGDPRFVDQPIFDTDEPILDQNGDFIAYKQVGIRKFDLAPEYEWVMFAASLNSKVLSDLKRCYAWERNHSLTRLRMEKEEERRKKDAALKAKRVDAAYEGLDEALLETRKRVQFGYGGTRNE